MSGNSTYRRAAQFQIVVGIGVIGWWAVAASTGGIEELQEGRTDIVFHIAAELSMAWLLIAAGMTILRRGTTHVATTLAGLALGALAYSCINSPGYFAERGEWWAVGMFAAIGAATALTAVKFATGGIGRHTGQERHFAVRSDPMNERRNSLDADRRIVGTP